MRLLITALTLLLTSTTFAQSDDGLLDESAHYRFYGHYWMNMHHFFQQEAMLRAHADTTLIDAQVMKSMTEFEVKRIENTVRFYLDSLIDKDLRSNDYQRAFKDWLITQNQRSLKGIPARFRTHCFNLIQASLTYRNYFWDTHKAAIDDILQSNIELVKSTEMEVTNLLSKLSQRDWQSEKIRVDICFVAKSTTSNLRNRPYTTLDPTHTIMHAFGAAEPHGNWLELLYHESSHHLITPVSGEVSNVISEVAARQLTNSPRQLWHAYLFYFAGKITQDQLSRKGIKNYELYMLRNNIYANYYNILNRYLPKYMKGKKSLTWATEKVIGKLDK